MVYPPLDKRIWTLATVHIGRTEDWKKDPLYPVVWTKKRGNNRWNPSDPIKCELMKFFDRIYRPTKYSIIKFHMRADNEIHHY